jgi:hypothetical protein
MVILNRLEALRGAIASRRWDETEFQFDRVLRAVTKAEASAKADQPRGEFHAAADVEIPEEQG